MTERSEDPPPFVFVVGCGRSGTTVLRTVLDSHPDLAVSHEGRFVAPLGLRRSRYERPEGFATDRLIADLTADRAVRTNLEFDEDDVRAALAGPAPDGFPDAVRRVFAHYAAVRGKSRYGDKFPGYVLRMDLLAGMFPEARFVHIVRDGRDVALSYRAIAPADAVTLAFDWRSRVSAGRAAGATLGPARYQEIRYEDLVNEPRPTVEGLCRFLDLAFDPAMLDFAAREGGVPAKVTTNPRHARLAEPLSPGTRSWRTHMEAADIAAYEAAAGDLLTECGYDRATNRPGAVARARAAWGRARWQASRASARLPGAVRRARGGGGYASP